VPNRNPSLWANWVTGSQNIDYRIREGTIQVKLDDSTYYPTLIIEGITSVAQMLEEGILGSGSNSLLFFDFNSFDVDLRKHYGSIKKLLDSSDSNHYFYYYEAGDYNSYYFKTYRYEAGDYNSYYFKTYRDVAELDTDKMGLSLEDGSLGYYQKILDNLKSHFGTKFADRIIIVSRFGDQLSKELKEYAYEIGLGKDMEVTFWSYDQIK